MFRRKKTSAGGHSPLKCILLQVIIFTVSSSSFASYLTAKGSKLYNDKGEVVRLTGANWFGFETTNMFPHGLWARDYHGIMNQIVQMGFNCIRIPYCNEMLRDDAKPDKPNFFGEDPFYLREKTLFNYELHGLTPLQILDEIIRYAGVLGLAVILDNHSREHDGYMNELVWYTDKITEKIWIDDWVMLADRYKNNPTVIGFDLENEPHGKTASGGATWATGNNATDWNSAAQKCGNAILAVNPDVLIIIEGVEQYGTTMYWWGGNMRGVKKNPIKLSQPDKLVYSPHEYGPEVHQQPWFFEAGFPDNLTKIWDDAFGFIAKEGTAPLLIGEFGISNMESYEGKAGKWFTKFLDYMKTLGISWTFWALNPNSGDTGGLLDNDWTSPVQWKLDQVTPLCAPLINEPIAVQKSYRGSITPDRLPHVHGRTVTFGNERHSSTQITLIDLTGKTVRSVAGTSMPVDGIAGGVYTVCLTGKNIPTLSARISLP